MTKTLIIGALAIILVFTGLQPILAQENNQEVINTLNSDQIHDKLVTLYDLTFESYNKWKELEQQGIEPDKTKIAYNNYLKHLKEFKEFKAQVGLNYGEI